MIKFWCHECGQKIGAPGEYGGKKVSCPQCGGVATVPMVTERIGPAKPLESRSTPGTAWGKRLTNKIVCPNCWEVFPPEESLFVAKHPELLDDPVLGANEFRRFVPTRFSLLGEALDPKEVPTTELACPRCHLQIPEAMLETAPLFISIIGSPASGKSYFLTTMTWELRRLLPRVLLSFTDADPVANGPIHEYERELFLNSEPSTPTEIRKTQQMDSRLHRLATINDMEVRFPIPLQFTLGAMPAHPEFGTGRRIGRIVVLYDNAGEDFLPAVESASSAAIQHLAKSDILFALHDLTQDPRLRAASNSDDPQLRYGLRPDGDGGTVLDRQETIIREASIRIRRYLGISHETRLRKPLIIIVPKFDIWQDMVDASIDEEPYVGLNGNPPVRMQLGRVEDVSTAIRELLMEFCPEFVATAEGLSEFVRYIPVSSFGCSPEYVTSNENNFFGIRPKNIRPKWVTVPLTYCLCKWATGLIPTAG